MKILTSLIIVVLVGASTSCSNSSNSRKIKIINKTEIKEGIATSNFTVWGNCGMCEETIESALEMNGISNADWNSDTKIISVTYVTSKVSLDQIQKKIASVGYDNIKYKADDGIYSELHECCQYDRK